MRRYNLNLNGESLAAWCGLIDVRTEAHKQRDRAVGRLAGPVAVFFTGHAQRPLDARRFAAELARRSRSGLVLLPVMDTPSGADPALHGDRGKVAALPTLLNGALAELGMQLEFSAPQTCRLEPLGCPGAEQLAVELLAVGWSHGGLLARRFASAYPADVVGLGQVCPAGYHRWPGGWLALMFDFMRESRRIAPMLLGRHAGDVLRANFGITRGLLGDIGRGLIAALRRRDARPALRFIRDIQDCNELLDARNCPLDPAQAVSVVFGLDDSVITASLKAFNDPASPTSTELATFWRRFYGESWTAPRALNFLPGNHLAPITACETYAATVLAGLGQLEER